MISKTIIFFFRAYNDIDHMTPIIYRLNKDYPEVTIKCIIIDLKNNFTSDYRLIYIKKLDVTINHISEYLGYPIIIINYYNSILNILSFNSLNKIFKVFKNFELKLFTKIFNSKLNKIDIKKFISSILYNSAGVFVFDQTYNKFYKKICTYLNQNNINSVAVPHGHNIFANELISIHSLNIKFNKGIQEHSMPYKYVVFETNIIANRFLNIGYVTKEQIQILGSSRFCDEWMQKIREILPSDNLPNLSKSIIKFVIMLSKPVYNVFVEEIIRTIQYISSFPGVFIIIKPHTRGESFNNFSFNKNVLIVDNKIHSPNLINWADVVLFTNSSIIFDCLKINKPTLYLKNTHANKILSEKYFKSWHIECRDDLRDFMWKFINDRKISTYSKEDRDRYCKDFLEPIGSDVLKYYTNFLTGLLK